MKIYMQHPLASQCVNSNEGVKKLTLGSMKSLLLGQALIFTSLKHVVWTIVLCNLELLFTLRLSSFFEQTMHDILSDHFNFPTTCQAVMRLCMPSKANVRYQCWLGKLTEGSRDYESGEHDECCKLPVS